MKKELRFSARIDTAEFDRAIENMQRRLEKVYEAGDRSRMSMQTRDRLAGGGIGAPSTPQDRAREEQNEKRQQRELKIFLRERVREEEAITRAIAEREKFMKNLTSTRQHETELGKRILDHHQKELDILKQKRATQEEIIKSGLSGLNQRSPMDYMSTGVRALMSGRFGTGMGMIGRGMGGPMGMLGAMSSAFAASNTGLDYFGFEQGRTQTQLASAMGNSAGRDINNLFSGRAIEDIMYRDVRKKAFEQANKEMAIRRLQDDLVIGSTIAGGAAAGGAAGSFFAGVGALPGAVVGGATAAGGLLFNDRLRAKMVQRVGQAVNVTTGIEGLENIGGREYEANLLRQREEDLRRKIEEMKELDPIRRATTEKYLQNAIPNLSYQRMLGMGDYDMNYLLGQGAGAGFSMDTTRQSMGAIMAAGGSTAAGRYSATFANRMARDFNATNTAEMIGRISGNMSGVGGGISAENATVRIMAEAVRLGFDRSEFAAENRRFTSLASEVVARSGAGTQAAAQDVTAGFSRFVNETSMGGVDAAKSAYDLQQRITGQGGGARGAIQAAFIASSPVLNKLSRDERSLFLNMTEEQISAGGFEMEAAAKKAKIPLSEFKKELLKMKDQSVSPRADIDARRDRLRSMLAGKTKEEQQKIMKSTEFEQELGAYGAGLSTTSEGYSRMNDKARRAFALGNVIGRENLPSDYKAEIEKEEEILRTGTGIRRAGDVVEGSRAVGDTAFLESLKTFGPTIDSSVESLSEFKDAVMESAKILREAYASGDVEKIREAGQKGAGLLYGTQPSGNVPGK